MKAFLLALVFATLAHAAVPWSGILKQPAEWYATPEARQVGDLVLAYQFPTGGWPKNRDMTLPPEATLPHDGKEHSDITHPTIDNDATTTQIRFLALLFTATAEVRFRVAADKGLKYLLDGQYSNGGWPQFFPEPKGYASHITFNDDAMINVMELLDDAASRHAPFNFVEAPVRLRARLATARGVKCILACQIRQEGVLTAWCAQHDEKTLAPAPARKFEPVSLSGLESVGIVRYLMKIKDPPEEVRASIEAAVAWFQKVKISGLRLVKTEAPGSPHGSDFHVEPDPAAPPLWARFYELGTFKPLFSDRDSVIKYSLAEIGIERRSGYHWYVTEPEKLLTHDYPAWHKRLEEKAHTP